MIDPKVLRESAHRGDTVYPYSVWMPLPENATQAKIKATQFIFHTEAGPSLTSLESLWKYLARGDVVIEPHWILDMDGRMAQCIAVNVKADNNAAANSRALSVETQDYGHPTLPSTPWTSAQVEQLAGVLAWASMNTRCALPITPCPAWDKPGYGPHNKFKEWSVYAGKTCPGQYRTKQIPLIAAMAQDFVNWQPGGANPSEDDMQVRTVIVTVQGRFAEFWTQCYLNDDGEPHVLEVTWSGPGDAAYEELKKNHGGDGTLMRREYPPHVAQNWFLNGDATKINDAKYAWSNEPNKDFRATSVR